MCTFYQIKSSLLREIFPLHVLFLNGNRWDKFSLEGRISQEIYPWDEFLGNSPSPFEVGEFSVITGLD